MSDWNFSAVLTIWLILINLFSLCIYGFDKRAARRNARRVPERTLILTAALGGSIGALIAMRLFHHKTRHPKFYIGVPVILVLQIAAAVFLYLKFTHVI